MIVTEFRLDPNRALVSAQSALDRAWALETVRTNSHGLLLASTCSPRGLLLPLVKNPIVPVGLLFHPRLQLL